MLFAALQGLERPAALGSIADGPDQKFAVHVSFNQIVLSAGPHGADG